MTSAAAAAADDSAADERTRLLRRPSLAAPPALEREADAPPRRIGWTSAFVLIVSKVFGAGIFATPGVVTQSAGSIGLSLLIWLLGALLAAGSAASSIEMGCLLPRSGGENVYIEHIYRRPKHLAITIISVKVLSQTSTAKNCLVFGDYLLQALPATAPPGSAKLAACALLTFSAIMHGLFLPHGLRVQNFLGFFKIAMILALTAIALYTLAVQPRGARPEHGLWHGSDWRLQSLSQGLLRVCTAYNGMDNANMVLNEVRDPIGMLRCVIPLALCTACALYLLVNTAFFAVLPVDVITERGQLAAYDFFAAIFGAGTGAQICSVCISCCIAGNVMAGVFSASRQNQEIARRSYYPVVFASSEPFNAPLGGVILNFLPTALIILTVPSAHFYSFLADAEGYVTQMAAFAVGAGLLWLRWARPHLDRPFKAFVPAVFLAVLACAWQVILPLAELFTSHTVWKGGYALVGLAILGLGTVYWVVWAHVLPRLCNQSLVEECGTLSDGTTYTSVRRVSARTSP